MRSPMFQASSAVSILGFDPGRDKCGVAVVTPDRQLQFHDVVAAATAIATLNRLLLQFPIQTLVIGDQTTSAQWQQTLRQNLVPSLPIVAVNERYSTLEARDRYWAMYPPQGLTRLIPQGMRDVPRPIDDIVAIILVERYLERSQPEAGP